MEPVASNIQVLLQAAEFLERREREAEHGYASLCPHRSPGPIHRRKKRPPQAPGAQDSGRSVHNELEKRRRAQLKRCLERLKQQMPLGADCARYTTLSLLRRARMHIQICRNWRSRSSGPGSSRRGCAASSRAYSGSWSSSGDWQGPPIGNGYGRTAWTPQASPPSGQTQTKRSWRWMWRAWCLGVRPSCYGASSRARSTATHTAAAPGYDVLHPGWASALCSCQAHLPGRSSPQVLRAIRSHLLEWTKRTLVWEQVLPHTLLLAARQALWKRQDSSGPP
ncbi:max dimerization protein 3 isoform X2 [Callithrix jacchus]|uniref:max dimerization protein 3 isoform X1 n=1 Tax=Callithrix jacchus TaxID=9483 RepID=UPI00159D75DF|nr:max dimerization protein 3 isoform X1 [Callithrix jacchus]